MCLPKRLVKSPNALVDLVQPLHHDDRRLLGHAVHVGLREVRSFLVLELSLDHSPVLLQRGPRAQHHREEQAQVNRRANPPAASGACRFPVEYAALVRVR